MATVTQIANLLKAALSTLPDVDQGSIDNYLPSVKTQAIGLIIPPLDQQTRAYVPTVSRGTRVYWHRIRCEFWIKLNSGDIAGAVARAREIGLQAIDTVLTIPTLNNDSLRVGWYGQNTGQSIEAEVTDRPIEISGIAYLVATVHVPIVDYGA